MAPKTVRKLEKKLHKAIVDVICDMGLKDLPLLPSQHTMEMMANQGGDGGLRSGGGELSTTPTGFHPGQPDASPVTEVVFALGKEDSLPMILPTSSQGTPATRTA